MSDLPPFAEKGAAHYFVFSRNWSGSERRCGQCDKTYDDGEHIEITTLKPYTRYVCPTGGGLGHSGIWTGALIHSLRTLTQHLCVCGAEFVEEDKEQWHLSWEMSGPWSDEWRPVNKIASKHAAHQQHEGLLALIDQGEPIRNVTLTRVTPPVKGAE